MTKTRLDQEVVNRGLVASRSQAESYIKLGKVKVNGKVASKPSVLVSKDDKIQMIDQEQYVSRAGLKLASVAKTLNLDFKDKIVLDVGSSTGGFTDYALRRGAKKVVAVDVGTDQMHPSLLGNRQLELHEKTDIRHFPAKGSTFRKDGVDIVLIDVSFISLRDILPHIASLITQNSMIVAMVKPQFEAHKSDQKHKGVIKNERIRRDILKDFENWIQNGFVVLNKADSEVSGAKGNTERFYLLKTNK